jgi:hypothetical protein
MTRPEVPTDDEFDEITDRMSRIILVVPIVEINEMLLDEPESQWEQMLGKGGLQQGLDQIKERETSSNDKDVITVNTKEIPSIIAQEPNVEDDRKMAYACCVGTFGWKVSATCGLRTGEDILLSCNCIRSGSKRMGSRRDWTGTVTLLGAVEKNPVLWYHMMEN